VRHSCSCMLLLLRSWRSSCVSGASRLCLVVAALAAGASCKLPSASTSCPPGITLCLPEALIGMHSYAVHLHTDSKNGATGPPAWQVGWGKDWHAWVCLGRQLRLMGCNFGGFSGLAVHARKLAVSVHVEGQNSSCLSKTCTVPPSQASDQSVVWHSRC
jgi:hypothetical protein